MHTNVGHSWPALSDVGTQLGELRLGHGLVGFVLQTSHLPAVELILAGRPWETPRATQHLLVVISKKAPAFIDGSTTNL